MADTETPGERTFIHLGPRDARGSALVTRVKGRESECEECTEPIGNDS